MVRKQNRVSKQQIANHRATNLTENYQKFNMQASPNYCILLSGKCFTYQTPVCLNPTVHLESRFVNCADNGSFQINSASFITNDFILSIDNMYIE